jgi:hypothetical protein
MNQLIKMFCKIDDYCKVYEQNIKKLLNKDELKQTIPKSSLALSEIITIVVYFHQSKIRNFKAYYKIMILGVLKSYFQKAVSYTRFVELMRYSLIPH